MNIRIVNLRNYKLNPGETLIKVDRSSPVGNPFFMHNESERDKVCDLYEEYFNQQMDGKTYGNSIKFKDYMRSILYYAVDHDIALGCWCAPKRCHAETIKAYLDATFEDGIIDIRD